MTESAADKMAEIEELRAQLPALCDELKRLRGEKALANKIANGEIKHKEEEIDELCRQIDEALHFERTVYERGVVEKVRIDTGEVVSTRAITTADRRLGTGV